MTQPTASRLPSWASLRRGWHDFFHESADPRICALVRIGYAALVLVNLAVLWPDLELWFSESGVLRAEVARAIVDESSWSVLSWPLSATWLYMCFGIYIAQAVCLLLGLASRFNAVCVFVWLVSFQNRNQILLDGEDTVFRIVGFFLIFMPLGQAWSLDAILRHRRGKTLAPASGWALRMLQIQMAVIYLSAALVKMQGETWMNGTAMYYVARLDDYFGRLPIPYLLFDTPALVAIFTWSVVAAEFVVPILVWFKETRVACLVVAAIFHIGCDYTMNLFLFHWIMLVGWMAFLTPEDLERLARLARGFGRRVGLVR